MTRWTDENIRGAVDGITHEALPMVKRGQPDSAYRDRARVQVSIADGVLALVRRMRP
ncbi:MAG: hypothetical protein ACRYGI_11620 [Janthinobacterium lividum]